jgi:hypothetical protein
MSSSSRNILRSGLCQLGTDEEPEEVAGSCDVIGKVISDCKHFADVISNKSRIKICNPQIIRRVNR